MGLFDRFWSAGSLAGGSGSPADTSEIDALRLIDEGNAIEEEGRIEDALQLYETAIRLAPNLARGHLNRGNVLLSMGDAGGALIAYRAAIKYNPEYAGAYFNMGNALQDIGQLDDAVESYHKALEINPDYAEAHNNLGLALVDKGLLDSAVASYRRALEIYPDFVEAHYNLGNALKGLGQQDGPVVSCHRVLEISPNCAEAHYNLGNALKDIGRLDDAVASYHRALAINPDYAVAHNNLGNALRDLNQFNAALVSYQRVLEIQPDNTEAHNNMGNSLRDLKQFDAAVVSYQRALASNPDYAEVHNNLGNALRDLGRFESAVASYRRALEIQPDYAAAHSNLGCTLRDLGQLDDAVASCYRALEIQPDYAAAHSNLGVALKDLGKLDQAVASLRRALEIQPDLVEALSNLLFILHYLADQPSPLLRAEACRYGELVERQAHPYTSWDNVPEPNRCLRVGLVSGDLRYHPVGYFVEGVLGALAEHAVGQLEIFAYSCFPHADALTERIKACCHGWHSAVGIPDEGLAQRIRDDGIDILIDLSGHTALNRLPLFAWKPAPVQVSWLGYFATTGVAAMDYLIADPWTLPKPEEAYFTEKIWRLPETRLCFTPPDLDVEVAPLPALSNGYITFGCFNNLTKMNDDVVALWARVLAAIPNSRLFLKSNQIKEKSIAQSIIKRFEGHGTDSKRLILEESAPRIEYLAAYRRVDIALDPFPYPGGTTSVESLWMGVPVLTLAGERFLSRQGVGLMMNAGLPEWTATDADDYVRRAISHAGDLQRLAALRNGLRRQVLASPIFDAPRFAGHFEDALRSMWRKWCDQQQ